MDAVETAGDLELLQNLRILDVEVQGDEIRVDVYGGDDMVCGMVAYHFPDAAKRRRQADTLRHWRDTCTAVTYIRRGMIVTLMDEVAMLEGSLNAPEAKGRHTGATPS